MILAMKLGTLQGEMTGRILGHEDKECLLEGAIDILSACSGHLPHDYIEVCASSAALIWYIDSVIWEPQGTDVQPSKKADIGVMTIFLA